MIKNRNNVIPKNSFREVLNETVLDENNPNSLFYRFGNFRYLTENIYDIYYLKKQIDNSKLLILKDSMENLYYDPKEEKLNEIINNVKLLKFPSNDL